MRPISRTEGSAAAAVPAPPVRVRLRPRLEQWLARRVEETAAEEYVLDARQQLGGRAAYNAAIYGSAEAHAARAAVVAARDVEPPAQAVALRPGIRPGIRPGLRRSRAVRCALAVAGQAPDQDVGQPRGDEGVGVHVRVAERHHVVHVRQRAQPLQEEGRRLGPLARSVDAVEGALHFSVVNGEAFGEGRGFHRGLCIAPSNWTLAGTEADETTTPEAMTIDGPAWKIEP